MNTAFLFNIRFSALSLLAAVDGAADSASGPSPVVVMQEMYSDSWFVRHSIIIALLLLLLLACLLLRWRRRPLEIFSNANGRIHVSRGALGDLVSGAALQYGAVSRPSVRFEKKRGQMHVRVWLKLGAGQRLAEFSGGLQTQIARALRDAFGIENIGGIHIIVTGFKGNPLTDDLQPVPYHGAAPVKSTARPRPPRPNEDSHSF